jgi:hypothetical protein
VTDPRLDRRRFLGGTVLLGLGAALGPAGLVALRPTARPGGSDLSLAGHVPHTHASHPILPAPVYATVVETRRTPAGVPYLAAVARPA